MTILTLQLESCQLEHEQRRIEMQKLAAEAEARERCLHEELEEKVLVGLSLFMLISCPDCIIILDIILMMVT